MKKRWIGSLVVCIFVLAISVPPSLARLNEGKLISISRVNNDNPSVQVYKVQSGDTLWDISRKYDTKVETLLSMNNIDRDKILDIGSNLKVPSTTGTIHVVTNGETMWSIASQYNVDVEKIMRANRDKDPENLDIGARISIPASGRLAAVTAKPEPSRNIVLNTMIWPIVGTITSSYGWRNKEFHHGLDIASKKGTPIYAAAAGTVSYVGYNGVYGRMVIISLPDGKKTLYAHTQNVFVKNKEVIARGEKIATVGMTGRTTGPHLHFEVRDGDNTYNPLRYLR